MVDRSDAGIVDTLQSGVWRGDNKKAPVFNRGFAEKRFGCAGLCFDHLACLDGLGGDPHALDLSTRELHAYALNVGAEAALRVFNEAGTDTTTLLGETLADDATAGDGALSCDCTNSRPSNSNLKKRVR